MRQHLPAHHLADDTKSLVSVSMAVVATISALVLGLLISNANASFSSVDGEVTALSAQILRLDQILRRYGPHRSTWLFRGRIDHLEHFSDLGCRSPACSLAMCC
jgi:hypothetical protein